MNEQTGKPEETAKTNEHKNADTGLDAKKKEKLNSIVDGKGRVVVHVLRDWMDNRKDKDDD